MRTHVLLLSLLMVGTLAPLASAATFCPPYNPNALVNCSVTVDIEDRSAYAPVPGTESHRQYIVGDIYVDYPYPTVNTFYVGEAPVAYSTGYAEVTAACPPRIDTTPILASAINWGDTGSVCHVTWDTRPPPSPFLA